MQLEGIRYSAYVSYAHADDNYWDHWISDFSAELERGIRARLRGIDLPPLYRGGADGPLQGGPLVNELKQRIAASFSMIVVVHNNYVLSEWCLQELALFKARHGEETWRERLYVVAMSRAAMEQLQVKDSWRSIVGSETVWLPFYRLEDDAAPLSVYEKNALSKSFLAPFGRLRDDLARKLRAAAELIQANPSAPASPPMATNRSVSHTDGNDQLDVFISHAGENRDWADAILKALESEGFACWIATRDILPGALAYAAEIARALKRSRLMVVVVSRDAGASSHVVREVTMAYDRGVTVLPLKVDAEPLSDAFEYFFTTAQVLLAADNRREAAMRSLLDAVRRHLVR